MTNESINEKLKKLIAKYNSIQGSLLTMGKRLTALEEKKPEVDFKIPDAAAFTYLINYMFEDSKPWIQEEVEEEIGTLEVSKETTEVIKTLAPGLLQEEVITPETEAALDEVIE